METKCGGFIKTINAINISNVIILKIIGIEVFFYRIFSLFNMLIIICLLLFWAKSEQTNYGSLICYYNYDFRRFSFKLQKVSTNQYAALIYFKSIII